MSVNVKILRSAGTVEEHVVSTDNCLEEIMALLNCDTLDLITIGDDHILAITPSAVEKQLPFNDSATAQYHSVPRPDPSSQVCGDAALFPRDAIRQVGATARTSLPAPTVRAMVERAQQLAFEAESPEALRRMIFLASIVGGRAQDTLSRIVARTQILHAIFAIDHWDCCREQFKTNADDRRVIAQALLDTTNAIFKIERVIAAINAQDIDAITVDAAFAAVAAAKGRAGASTYTLNHDIIERSAWLIEQERDGKTRYLAVTAGEIGWTEDHNAALQLARREDADALTSLVEDADKVAEHSWIALRDQDAVVGYGTEQASDRQDA